MQTREDLLAAVVARLDLIAQTEDCSPALKLGAWRDARRLARLGDAQDLEAWHKIGLLYWYRSQGLPGALGRSDRDTAVALLAPCFAAGFPIPDPPLPQVVEKAVPGAAVGLQEAHESGDPVAIATATQVWRRVTAATPIGHPERAWRLSLLASTLWTCYQHTDELEDLDPAIAALRDAAEATPADDPELASCLRKLATAQRHRFDQHGDPADLDAAIINLRCAATPPGPGLATSLSLLGMSLWDRFKRSDTLEDVDEAVTSLAQAVAATPANDPDRASRLENLSVAHWSRLLRSGDLNDANDAITNMALAVAATRVGDPRRSRRLGSLGTGFATRFNQVGDLADLDAAVSYLRQAMAEVDEREPERITLLNNLGGALVDRFDRLGDPADLDEAIGSFQGAVDAVSADDPHWVRPMSNLGATLNERSKWTGHIEDANRAADILQKAIDATPADHPERAAYLSNLGDPLLTRYKHTRDEADLDRAIAAIQEAVEATPYDHPDRARRLSNLGSALARRFLETGPPDHVAEAAEAVRAYARATEVASARPAVRIHAAEAAAVLGAHTEPTLIARLLDTAVRLIPLTAPRQLRRADQQHAMSNYAHVAGNAAALTLEVGEPDAASHALGLLELGRAVLHSQALDTRSDLTDLPADLAARFIHLRDLLDRADAGPSESAALTGTPFDDAPGTPDRHHAAAEFAALQEHIRGIEGFEAFLLPPEPSSLTAQAQAGPIVVFNISRYRSDAIMVTSQSISHVQLPDLDIETLTGKVASFHDALRAAVGPTASGELANTQDDLSQILEWLWDTAAEPVLSHLGHLGPRQPTKPGSWPRIWWVPGGLLGQLPLHAAGYHRQPGGRTVMDRVISSYTPTLCPGLRQGSQPTSRPAAA